MHEIQVGCQSNFREPSRRGAALYFLRPPAEVEVINNINGDPVNLYKVVKVHLEEFVRQCKWAPSSREMFKWLKDTPAETLTDVLRAPRSYYLQHQCFGGEIQSQGWGTDTHVRPVNLLRIEKQRPCAWPARTSSGWTGGSASSATTGRTPSIYLDPPYWQTERYEVPFPFAEYQAMAEVLRGLKGEAILSIFGWCSTGCMPKCWTSAT